MPSEACVGTMLWGRHTPAAEAHAMISVALDRGVCFFDTAAAYPTWPYAAETFGLSETIIGDWIRRNGRGDMRISTKMRSPMAVDGIESAVDDSLRRLNIDAIDYYQFHWPNRGSYCFGNNWHYDPTSQDTSRTLELMTGSLGRLDALVRAGKIRTLGMSNETAWGVTKWNCIARQNGWASLRFVQNEYSLLHRLFDLDMAEACHHEDMGLFAWTPLAGGLLTGKYSRDHSPPGSRRTKGCLGRRDGENVWPALHEYQQVAADFGLDMVHMSLSWVASRPMTTAVIVGATNAEQLSHNLGYQHVSLSREILDRLDAVHRKHPLPF